MSTNSKITIYKTPTCAFCHTEMQWLDSLGIAYEAKDIEQDAGAREELDSKLDNFVGVPVTDIAGDIIVGFDRPKLLESLKTHGLN